MPAGGQDQHTPDTSRAYESLAGAYDAPGDGSTQTISLGAAAAAVTGLAPRRSYMVVSTQPCHVVFTADGGGDATTSDAYLVGDVPYFFKMTKDRTRCSAIESGGAGGTLYLTRLGD